MGRYSITKADLDAAKDELTDEMFFTSRNYHRFLRNIMDGIVNGEYIRLELANRDKLGIKTRLALDKKQRFGGFLLTVEWDPDSDMTAYCSPNRIHINAANHMGEKNLSRREIHRIVTAMLVHEVGHFLYTDYIDIRVWLNQLERNQWHPRVPVALLGTKAGQDLATVMQNPLGRELVCKLGKNTWNMLEDGYVELRLKAENPGYPKEALEYIRKVNNKHSPTLSEHLKVTRNDGTPDQVAIFSQVLHCAIHGEYNFGNEKEVPNEVMDVLDELYFPIRDARAQRNVLKRTEARNEVMAFLGSVIKDLYDAMDQQSQNQGQGGVSQQDIEDIIEQILQGAGASGNSSSDAGGQDQQQQDRKTHSVAAAVGSDDDGEVPQGTGAGGGGKDSNADSQGDCQDDVADEDGSGQSVAAQPQGGTKTGGQGGGKQPSLQDIDQMLSGLENTLERDIAKQKAAHRQKDDLQAGANSIATKPDFYDPDFVVHRDIEVTDMMVQKYEEYLDGNRGHIDSLVREVLAAVQPRREGKVLPGNMLGKTVSKRAFSRFDARIFNRKIQQQTSPKIAVAAAIDCSGSTCGITDHLLRTGVIIEAFCRQVDVPLQLFGYTDGMGNDVHILSAVEYEKADDNDKYRIMSLAPRGGTPTAAATLYAIEGLEKRDEDTKLLIVMSDGASGDNNYRGVGKAGDSRYGNTGRPISDLVQYAKEKGIVVIAFGIGSDARSIGAEFGYDNFVDMSNSETMPEEVAKLISENVYV